MAQNSIRDNISAFVDKVNHIHASIMAALRAIGGQRFHNVGLTECAIGFEEQLNDVS